jgi:tetratricopeptide (TPR) repeat protein
VSDAGVKRARDVARELERIRLVFQTALVRMQQDPGLPIVIFAVKNEKGLRELIPEYWEREGPKPAGVFQRGSDSHYVVLRVDVGADERYPTIYHEYFHLLLSLNTRVVPVWLNEGLAEFWDQTRIRESRVEMGLPNANRLEFLQRERMLPLHTLLSMKENPHHSDPERVSIFYAQAWALTHLLMLGDPASGSASAIGTYLGLVDEGADSVEAFISAFGALDVMEQKLERYVRQSRMFSIRMEAPDKIDGNSFPGIELSEATSAAERGRFLVSGSRPEAALPLLERALALAPDSALALEAMGFYYFRRDERDQAREWFTKAVVLDSESFLCHFYLAQLLADQGNAGMDQAKEALRRTIELNPKFAPAYAELGRLFVATGVRLESVRGMAFKAVELEPDNAWYWVNLGRILLSMDQPGDAAAAADRARAVARSDDVSQMVDRLEREVSVYQRLGAVGLSDSALAPRERRLGENDLRIEGRFVELRCLDQGQSFDFVVESGGRTLVFRTDSPGTIQLLERGDSVIRDIECGPKDAPVAVIYTPLSGDADANVGGELRVLEFLR